MQVLGEMYQTLLLTGLIMSNPTSVWKHLTANATSQRGLGKTAGLSLSILWLSNDAQWHKALMIYRRSRRIQIFLTAIRKWTWLGHCQTSSTIYVVYCWTHLANYIMHKSAFCSTYVSPKWIWWVTKLVCCRGVQTKYVIWNSASCPPLECLIQACFRYLSRMRINYHVFISRVAWIINISHFLRFYANLEIAEDTARQATSFKAVQNEISW